MPLNTILGPIKISGNLDTDSGPFPAITTLSNGSFAVSYDVIDYVNFIPIISQVFNGQGQLVQETVTPLLLDLSDDESDIAGLSGGGFALAWTGMVIDPVTGKGVIKAFTRVYDSAGTPLSGPVRVDADSTLANEQLPQVTALSNGGYVVTWVMADQVQGTDVMAAVYNSAGQQVVTPINVTHSPGVGDSTWFQTSQVGPLANGGFALTWTTQNSDFDRDIYTAIYDAQGQPVLAPLNLTHSTLTDETDPQIAVLSNGNYALSWDGVTEPTSFVIRNAYTAVFDAQGQQIAAPSVVGPGTGSRIAALTNGDYAVMWSDLNEVFIAVYDDQGAQIVAPVTVGGAPGANSFTGGGLTALPNGAFALTWDVQAFDGSFDIFTAVYDSQGHQLVAPVHVSNSPGVMGTFETVDAKAAANGSYAITWQGPGSLLPAEYLAIYQFTNDQNVGEINIVGGSDITLDLSAIITVGGDVNISNNDNLVTLDLHNLASIGGNFVLTNNGALLTITLPNLATVTGSVDISNNNGATTIGLGSLTTVSGSISIENNSVAGSVDLGNLTTAGSVDISNDTGATTIGLGNLTTVAGSVSIGNNLAAGSVDLGSLETAGGAISIGGNTAAGSVDLGSLTSAGSVDVSNNTGATTIGLGSLTTVSGSANVSGNTSVLTIDLGALVRAGAIIIANNGVVALNLSALVEAGGDVSISENHRLLSIDMPDLASVGGDLDISNNDLLGTINLSGIETVGGDLDISGNAALGVIDVGGNSVGGDLVISNNDSASLIDVGGNSAGGDLIISGDLDISDNDSAGIINVSAGVGGDLIISDNGSAGVINLAGTNTVGGDLIIDLSADATVDASSLSSSGGTVHVIGDDGHETDVILGSLAQMQGTLTITTADGVTLTAAAGLQTITLNGTVAGNTLIGSTTSQNIVNAGAGDDAATGGNNDDLFTGGPGNDMLDGLGGTDTAIFSGNFADYSIIRHADGSLTATDLRVNLPDGTDTLSNFELFQFADGVRTLAEVLPVLTITSNGGSDTAQALIAENTTAVTQVAATNPNAVETLQFAIIGGADAANFRIDGATGVLSFIAAPDFEHATDSDGNNVYDLIVQASDGFHAGTQALAVSVTNVNEAPTLANQTANQSAIAGTPFSLTLPTNTFQDPDSGDHLALAATLSNGNSLPTWLSFNPGSGAFSGTAGAGDAGGFDVEVTATDTGGLTASEMFHFLVSAPSANHAPVITSDQGGATASVIITDDTKYVATVHASDADPGSTITYSIVGGTDQKLFAIDPKSGMLSFKTTPQDGHSYKVTVAASDGSLQDTQAIKVQVANGPFESGNAGVADTFAFKPHFGLAVLSNFDATSPNHDVLEFDHLLFRNANPAASPAATFDLVQHHSVQVGTDVLIITDNLDLIDLRNAHLHNLTANDFLLV